MTYKPMFEKSNNWENQKSAMRSYLSNFLSSLTCLRSLNLGNTSSTLGSENTTTPVTAELVVTVVEVGLDGFQKLGECTAVTRLNIVESNTGAGLSVHESSKTCLSFDDTVWNSHLTAKGWKKQN